MGYGIASFPSTNVTPSTLFYTGSTTKAFTAAVLAMLIEDSVNDTKPLTWRTPISSLIRDDFVLPDEYATAHVTLEDAASHRTGMPRHDSSYGGSGFGLRDVVRNLRNLPMTAEIRTRFQYCNMMYMTLSHVIETLTGSWLGNILYDRIWKPLDMTHTYFSLVQAQQAVRNGEADLAMGYVWVNRTQKYAEAGWMDIPLVSGAGDVISNVEDYAKWLRFLIHQAPPLSKAGHADLRHPRTVLPDFDVIPGATGISAYALGWEILNYRGEPLITHSGGLPGFGALVGYLPNRNFGIVIMGNTAETSNVVEYAIVLRLLDDFLGTPEEERGEDIENVFERLLFKPKRELLAHPVKHLYPKAPKGKDAIPHARPIEKYTGIYHNAGYGNFTLTLSASPSPHLESSINRTFRYTFSFQHISGEFFLVTAYPDTNTTSDLDTSDPFRTMLMKAEFRVGEDGVVRELGAGLEPEMGLDGKVWFARV
ncbi:MAG: hypothetical protein LQ350_000128 [Teloschistes chrysophthalmus]|nr:MAG: hypothetical protein LQ350_000128 [Niorma chrysophthalma]